MGGKGGKKRQWCGNGWQGRRQKRQGWAGYLPRPDRHVRDCGGV